MHCIEATTHKKWLILSGEKCAMDKIHDKSENDRPGGRAVGPITQLTSNTPTVMIGQRGFCTSVHSLESRK